MRPIFDRNRRRDRPEREERRRQRRAKIAARHMPDPRQRPAYR